MPISGIDINLTKIYALNDDMVRKITTRTAEVHKICKVGMTTDQKK